MILYNKIKKFVKGYLPNKVQKENKSNILMNGFVEGCYNFEEFDKESKIRENNKQGENIEDMIRDTEELLNNARAY